MHFLCNELGPLESVVPRAKGAGGGSGRLILCSCKCVLLRVIVLHLSLGSFDRIVR